jgi:hypothetical protein
MFRVAHRSSSGALTVFTASGLHTHVPGRSQVRVGTAVPTRTGTVNTVRAPDDEWCATRNMLSFQ